MRFRVFFSSFFSFLFFFSFLSVYFFSAFVIPSCISLDWSRWACWACFNFVSPTCFILAYLFFFKKKPEISHERLLSV